MELNQMVSRTPNLHFNIKVNSNNIYHQVQIPRKLDITEYLDPDIKIHNRIGHAREAFTKVRALLNNKGLNLPLQYHFVIFGY